MRNSAVLAVRRNVWCALSRAVTPAAPAPGKAARVPFGTSRTGDSAHSATGSPNSGTAEFSTAGAPRRGADRVQVRPGAHVPRADVRR